MESTTVYTVCTLLLIINGTDGLLLSLYKSMTKSSELIPGLTSGDGKAYKAVDGNKDRTPEVCKCCAGTGHTPNTWFRLDLGKDFIIESLEILGREKPSGTVLYRRLAFQQCLSAYAMSGDLPHASRKNQLLQEKTKKNFQNMTISLIDENSTITSQEPIPDKVYVVNRSFSPPVVARYVNMQIPQKGHFTLCEISVYGNCVDGRFGDDCDTICHCKNGPCNKTTGVCPAGGCKSGYFGETCPTGCLDGKFGEDCTEFCGSCFNNDPCDKKTGNCTSCAPGYENDLICKTECQDGKYGQACGFNCSGNCLDSVPCNKTTGSCDLCAVGFIGSKCDVECPDGYFGLNCTRRCYCKEGVCNKITGTCPGLCAPGYVGPACESECLHGSYGQNCSSICGKCANNVTCNHIDGTCTECAPGYLTVFCNQTCPPGNFGLDCLEQCGECRDEPHCPFTNGVCLNGCDRGYRDSTCKQVCDDGTFGYNCDTACGSCKDDVICNKIHGTCLLGCKAGYKPVTCLEECDDKTFGENCAFLCGTCLNNSPCNKTTGLCDEGCGAGYNGTFCNNTCTPGTYGLGCNETCSEDCLNGTVCDFVTGLCDLGCGPGYTSGECKSDEEDQGIGPVIGGVVGGVVGLALMSILLLVFIRRRRNKPKRKESNKHFSPVLVDRPDSHPRGAKDPKRQGIDEIKKLPRDQNGTQHTSESNMEVKVGSKRHAHKNSNQNGASASDSNLSICKIWDYINEMKTNNCNPFYQEFGLLKKELLHPHKVADQNRPKNRYKGICSFDYNRVPLNVDTQDESEYINASFINGFEKGEKFIASQGPVPEMVKDFWRMIWQYNCEQIVMLTNLLERGTKRCMQYWAEEEDITFGTITIKPGRVETTTDYIIRHLTFCKNNEPAKFVTLYHFKCWPDKDVPDSTWSLIKFWLRVTKDTIVKKDSPPVVVHCSAGVGRTGIYIALDYLYNQGNIEGQLRPFQAVKDLRDQRPSMVQTKEQYVFIHEAVADAFLFGTHFILLNQMQDVYNYLSQDDPATKMSRMFMQYQLIVDSVEDLYRAENEGLYVNETEYSNINMKTPYSDRTKKLGSVFIKDFKGNESLIVAATPTSATMETFWSLVSENNVTTVVIVTEPASPTYKEFLFKPNNGSKDKIQVSILGEKASSCFIDRQFQYTGKEAAKVPVHLIEYTNWTDSRDVPGDRQSMIALLDHVVECQDRCFDKQPILILCTTGHLKSGVVCALLNEFYRIKNDGGHINIVETVKLLKEKHRFAVPKFEQYKYIYDVILSKVCGDQIYENV